MWLQRCNADAPVVRARCLASGKIYTGSAGPVRASAGGVRYLVTGGAGFIGSHIVERLVRTGAEVTVLDDLSTGQREHLRAVRDRIRFIRGDAVRLEVCRRAMQGVGCVFHQAAVTSVPKSTRNPLGAHHANVTATLIIIATIGLGGFILVESALSFLGFGVPPPYPSWGAMLSGSGRSYFYTAPWMAVWPGAAISLAVFGFNMLGDALRDVLDPRLRGSGRSPALL